MTTRGRRGYVLTFHQLLRFFSFAYIPFLTQFNDWQSREVPSISTTQFHLATLRYTNPPPHSSSPRSPPPPHQANTSSASTRSGPASPPIKPPRNITRHARTSRLRAPQGASSRRGLESPRTWRAGPKVCELCSFLCVRRVGKEKLMRWSGRYVCVGGPVL